MDKIESLLQEILIELREIKRNIPDNKKGVVPQMTSNIAKDIEKMRKDIMNNIKVPDINSIGVSGGIPGATGIGFGTTAAGVPDVAKLLQKARADAEKKIKEAKNEDTEDNK